MLTVGAIEYEIYQAEQAPPISIPEVEEKSETIVVPKKPDRTVNFPANPNTFNPVGLIYSQTLKYFDGMKILIIQMDHITIYMERVIITQA